MRSGRPSPTWNTNDTRRCPIRSIGGSLTRPTFPCPLCQQPLYQKAKLGRFGNTLDLNDWGCPRCKKTVTLRTDDLVATKYKLALSRYTVVSDSIFPYQRTMEHPSQTAVDAQLKALIRHQITASPGPRSWPRKVENSITSSSSCPEPSRSKMVSPPSGEAAPRS